MTTIEAPKTTPKEVDWELRCREENEYGHRCILALDHMSDHAAFGRSWPNPLLRQAAERSGETA